MTVLPERPVDPDWLALREPADAASRDGAADLILLPLLKYVREADVGVRGTRSGEASARSPQDAFAVRRDGRGTSRGHGLRIVDLGAGTGANLRWLAPRLAAITGTGDLRAQRWTLVDHDPRLSAWGPAHATTVCADVADLATVLSDMQGADLVTAAALLDLLDEGQVTAIVKAVVAHHAPALFSLSVTGAVTLDPADPLDGPLAAAFDAHQRRDGRLGPDAGPVVAARFRERGWSVVEAQTPWRLESHQGELVDAWLLGRVEAAVEWQPDLAAVAASWLMSRRAQRSGGALSAVIGHVDVLALPPADPT